MSRTLRNPAYAPLKRRWLLSETGYLLQHGSALLGGPYTEIALVFGPQPVEPQKEAPRGRGRPRTRGLKAHESLGQAVSQMARASASAPPAPLGPRVLLMTAPLDAAREYAAEVVATLQQQGHADSQEHVLLVAGAFDPNVINAALASPAHAQAFLVDWQAGAAQSLPIAAQEAGPGEAPPASPAGQEPPRG